jgi:hypothetical protein
MLICPLIIGNASDSKIPGRPHWTDWLGAQILDELARDASAPEAAGTTQDVSDLRRGHREAGQARRADLGACHLCAYGWRIILSAATFCENPRMEAISDSR